MLQEDKIELHPLVGGYRCFPFGTIILFQWTSTLCSLERWDEQPRTNMRRKSQTWPMTVSIIKESAYFWSIKSFLLSANWGFCSPVWNRVAREKASTVVCWAGCSQPQVLLYFPLQERSFRLEKFHSGFFLSKNS